MTEPRQHPRRRVWLLVGGALGLLLAAGYAWWDRSQTLVVYCAHDATYAEPVLRRFEHQTGIRVAIRFDTEATKSLGLVNLLVRERDHPRCDVFWNNELLGTLSLQEQGVLAPYQGPGYERIPTRYKDPEGYWTGFAARLRVYIVNIKRLPPDPLRIARALAGDLSRMAVAKPLYGTTLTHYCVLWNEWGPARLKAWHRATRKQHVREVAGNATVMQLVSQGVCDIGWTDTDDYFVAVDQKRTVAMLPIRTTRNETICIPNTVAIIRGTRRKQDAQRLVDYLLSSENELELARSPSRQIPLGPVDDSQVPGEVQQLRAWADEGCDLRVLGDARRECLAWLKGEYLR